MKPTLLFSFLLLTLLSSCKKDGLDKGVHDIQYSTRPETLPEFDNTNYGVYRGVIVGSSGTVVIRVRNSNNEIKAYIDFEGFKDTLHVNNEVYFKSAITRLAMKGRRSSALFSVAGNGSAPKIEQLIIDGKLRRGFVFHENSNEMISLYKGKMYSPDVINAQGEVVKEKETGVFNCIRVGNKSLREEDGKDDFYVYVKFYDLPLDFYSVKTEHPMREDPLMDYSVLLRSEFSSAYLHKFLFTIPYLGTDQEEVWGTLTREGNDFFMPMEHFRIVSKRIN